MPKRIYAPVRYPKVFNLESPMAQDMMRQSFDAHEANQLDQSRDCYRQAEKLEREFQEAVQVRFAC